MTCFKTLSAPQRSSFRHAGDAGDIIYSLPVIRYKGGGTLYLEPTVYTRVKMTPERVEQFQELFESQHYIDAVKFWHGQEVEYNLNEFRFRFKEHHRSETLVQMQLRSHGVPESELDKPWIHVKPRHEAEVVFNLTERYRNKEFPWRMLASNYLDINAGFVGSKREHSIFEKAFGKVRHLETKTLMDVARVIRGSKLFIGNQSCPLAIAHAMHHPTICEHSRTGIDGMHRTINCVGTAGKTIELPRIL